jgi:hypothetical protein
MLIPADKLSLEVAVRRGVKLLDENITDWYKAIDISSLALQNNCNCVLGKLFRDYRNGLQHFETLLGDQYFKYGSYYGFTVPNDITFSETDAAFDMLTALWSKEIKKRKDSTECMGR